MKSIMGVMMLAAGCGSEVEFAINGVDAGACSLALRDLVTLGFFPMDAHRTLENYIKASRDRSADSLAAVAFSNNDLHYWYTRTSPQHEAREFALALSGWAAQQWPPTNRDPDQDDPEKEDVFEEPGPNRTRFIELVTARLGEIER